MNDQELRDAIGSTIRAIMYPRRRPYTYRVVREQSIGDMVGFRIERIGANGRVFSGWWVRSHWLEEVPRPLVCSECGRPVVTANMQPALHATAEDAADCADARGDRVWQPVYGDER